MKQRAGFVVDSFVSPSCVLTESRQTNIGIIEDRALIACLARVTAYQAFFQEEPAQ